MSKVALVQFGYQTYAIPVEALSATLANFSALRKVEKRYEAGGYVYWYSDDADGEIDVTVIAGSRIQDSEPGKAPASPPAPATVKPPEPADERLIAAPGDEPISIRSVPPMREFVDEFRHEEAPL
jgi:hypothetical protein